MQIFKTVGQMQTYRKTIGQKSVGFVPTMGALHRGHVSLIEQSRHENDLSIVSIYLNPTQFNDKKDLAGYPVTWEQDKAILDDLGVDVLFAPDYREMYPDDYRYRISEDRLAKTLCGAARPGHFDGVLTIVMKLFQIVGACNAYFGEKDYQQYRLIRGMADAFFLPVRIIPCPIVREEDGLAMSSRNVRLGQRARSKAPVLYRELSSGRPLSEIKKFLEKAGFEIDYLEEHEGRRYAAVFLDGVRLIDNVKS
ncbi:MAG: pantoate--beta-alanine ligase [Spirochaetales bacterium]|nr:pantoate--beta-alanine ligase [Spirochaetales bacterium]